MAYATDHMQPADERSSHSNDQPDATVRMTVQEAAEALGVTVEAVRGRMHRGKYEREKADDGRVFVILTPDQLANDRERFDERSSQRSRDQTANVPGPDHALVGELVEELAEELRQQVEFLRAELATRNEELRRREEEHREESLRKDHIIMSLAQRVPELPPGSQEPPDAPENGPDLRPGVDPMGDDAGAEAGVSRRSGWWRRLFGG